MLEETRAQLQSGLADIGSADYITAGSHLRDDERGNGALRTFRIPIVRLVQRGKKDEHWKPKPTDVVLLCTFLPKSVENLQRQSGELCTLAWISNSDDDFIASFNATAWMDTASPMYDDKVNSNRMWYAIYVSNAATLKRIWDALNPDPAVVQNPKLHTIVKQNVYKDGELVQVG